MQPRLASASVFCGWNCDEGLITPHRAWSWPCDGFCFTVLDTGGHPCTPSTLLRRPCFEEYQDSIVPCFPGT